MVSFTGSTRAGRRVSELAAATVKPVAMELGGKSPNVLLDDADFARAVPDGVAKWPLPVPGKPQGAPDRAQGEIARGIATGWQRLVTAVLDCEKPVVAAINGTAAGRACTLRSPAISW